MERLTRPNLNVDQDTDRFLHAVIGGKEIDWKQGRDSTLNVLINGPTSNGFGKDIFRKMARDLYGRLKAYEDTGLTPGQVHETYDEYCLLESALKNYGSHKRMKELAEADQEGRCVVPPCKVGDTVWLSQLFYTRPKKPLPVTVDAIRIDREGMMFITGRRRFSEEAIGKTVFLSKEEAEKAL